MKSTLTFAQVQRHYPAGLQLSDLRSLDTLQHEEILEWAFITHPPLPGATYTTQLYHWGVWVSAQLHGRCTYLLMSFQKLSAPELHYLTGLGLDVFYVLPTAHLFTPATPARVSSGPYPATGDNI